VHRPICASVHPRPTPVLRDELDAGFLLSFNRGLAPSPVYRRLDRRCRLIQDARSSAWIICVSRSTHFRSSTGRGPWRHWMASPLRVRSRHGRAADPGPLCHQKRTWKPATSKSALGHKRSSTSQPILMRRVPTFPPPIYPSSRDLFWASMGLRWAAYCARRQHLAADALFALGTNAIASALNGERAFLFRQRSSG
jgi:hypothetical protein